MKFRGKRSFVRYYSKSFDGFIGEKPRVKGMGEFRMASDAYMIADLLKRDPGYVIELNDLCVSQLSDGSYRVAYYGVDEGGVPLESRFSETFKNPHTAAELFLKKRRELQLGFDYAKKVTPLLPPLGEPVIPRPSECHFG